MKILVAEDDKVARILLERLLTRGGHEVVSCSDGAEAIDAYKQNDVQIVISDWMMPKMSGVEFCEGVREFNSKNDRQCYFIMVTAKTQNEDMMYALKIGVDDFITKPYNEEVLVSRIEFGKNILKGSVPPTPSAENDPIAMLKDDHKILRSMAEVLDLVHDRLDTGVPNEVLEQMSYSALLVNLDYHIEKESIYISAFLDKVLIEYGEWFNEVSQSSFTQINEEHQELEKLLRDLQGNLAVYFEKRKRVVSLLKESMTSLIDMDDDNLRWDGLLLDQQKNLDSYFEKKNETIPILKENIKTFADLLRSHLEKEETVFFPFSRRYFTEKDMNSIAEEFKEIQENIKDKLTIHNTEVQKWRAFLE